MRFQPRLGRFLAAATGNLVTVLDVETQVCVLKLQVSCHPFLVIFLPTFNVRKTKSSKACFSYQIDLESLLYMNISQEFQFGISLETGLLDLTYIFPSSH